MVCVYPIQRVPDKPKWLYIDDVNDIKFNWNAVAADNINGALPYREYGKLYRDKWNLTTSFTSLPSH